MGMGRRKPSPAENLKGSGDEKQNIDVPVIRARAPLYAGDRR